MIMWRPLSEAPYDRDRNMLGSILGPTVVGNSQMGAALKTKVSCHAPCFNCRSHLFSRAEVMVDAYG